MNKIQDLYKNLYKKYSPQGWWPLTIKGNHSKHYAGKPRIENHRFEIIIGAILTQNTNWKNVEKALYNLSKNNLININKIKTVNQEKLAGLIRPSGYYNQKAERLKIIAEFLTKNKNPTREQLLNLKGIGPETADSILLYAFEKPSFVVDAYTRRILLNLNLIKEKATYDEIKELFEKNLKQDVDIYKEYHALLVEHAKNHCKVKPICNGCPIRQSCKK